MGLVESGNFSIHQTFSSYYLGCDGAPFGKDDTACRACLVHFQMLREMEFIYGNENFLIFGGNCSENSGEDGKIR